MIYLLLGINIKEKESSGKNKNDMAFAKVREYSRAARLSGQNTPCFLGSYRLT